MSRSLKKGPYINEKLIQKIKNLKAGDKTVIKTWDRGAVITPEMVGFRIGVHDGRKHIEVLIVEDMVGHKLGEFAPTRKFQRHGGRMAREEAQAVVAKDAISNTGKTEEKKESK
jgi:small subunit ribosomal protein S19